MFSKIRTMKFTKDFLKQIKEFKNKLDTVDAVVIGAGAGLSTSAGFVYDGERFDKNFSDFKEKYGFKDMYTGGFYPYDTFEEHWAYWSRYIYVNRYTEPPKPVYENLFELVKNKDYFVITTNVDHCFQKSGFDKKRLFYTQGDYGLFQCSEPCCNLTFENEKIIKQMVEQQRNMRIPSELLPICPYCGKPMTMNLRSDNKFVENEGWNNAAESYEMFLSRHKDLDILFLELGVGYNTPAIIKYPFWQMTAKWENAFYVCINNGQAAAPEEINKKSLCINDDIGFILQELSKLYKV